MAATTPDPGPYDFGAFLRVDALSWAPTVSTWYPYVQFVQLAGGWRNQQGVLEFTGNPDHAHLQIQLQYSETDGGFSWTLSGPPSLLRLQPVLRDRVTLEVLDLTVTFPELIDTAGAWFYAGGGSVTIGPTTFRQFLSQEITAEFPFALIVMYENYDSSIGAPTLPFQSSLARWLTADAT